jgi:hypothetical protein
MCAAIEIPGKCEIRTVICFLQAEDHSAAEIHCRMTAVYGPNFMSDKCFREWCRKFHDGRTDVHDEGGQGQPSLVTDDFVQHTDTRPSDDDFRTAYVYHITVVQQNPL